MSCILTIIGEHFDVDTFYELVKIPQFERFYKGEPINAVNPRERKHSFATIVTSEASFSDYQQQVEDTYEFLEKHQESLKHIKSTPNIEYATINFGIDAEINEERLTQSLYFPEKLVIICGILGIGIEASLYHPRVNEILAERYNKKG
ncbi:MAG: hypothetical protein EOP51_23510 [Sphingobacteriales bacterium]|nr:MAG: hypothetical protein EOP51_23510 [Sphingobacteriales bacterium]